MRELLVTVTLLSIVSSQEFETFFSFTRVLETNDLRYEKNLSNLSCRKFGRWIKPSIQKAGLLAIFLFICLLNFFSFTRVLETNDLRYEKNLSNLSCRKFGRWIKPSIQKAGLLAIFLFICLLNFFSFTRVLETNDLRYEKNLSNLSCRKFGRWIKPSIQKPKKRLGIPPEEDPNFWPTRGRRSYWSDSRIFGNTLRHRDLPQNSEIGYPSHSWSSEGNFLGSSGGLQDYLDTWGLSLCPRKKSISLVLPLPGFRDDDIEIPTCGGRCPQNRGRGRRGGERWRSQQPLYVEEPRWIALDYNQGILGGSVGDEDPFIVARGRKRSELMDARGSYLDVVLSPRDTDPFFVARGKREAKKSDKQLSESGPISEFDTKAAGVSSAAGKKSGSRPRAVRSTTDIFEGDDFENGVKLAPRYSHPRDKHSNLQGILDEPFFISRGKKAYYEDGGVRFSHDVDYQDPVFEEISRLYTEKKSKAQNKPPRNRRGMLDELLTSDDPFYVARGKKLAPRSQYFDLTINRADESPPNANGKYSIFAKSTRTKLMQKLSDFSKDHSGGDSFGVNDEPMMKTV